MARSRAPDATLEGRRAPLALPPGASPPPSAARDILLKSWPGRLFLIAAGLKLIVALLRQATGLPGFFEILDTAATLGLIVSLSIFTARLFMRIKRRLLWRVRRKLILSYIFIGVVPVALIIGLFVLAAWVVSMNVSAYLFRDGYDDVVRFTRLAAEGVASEIGRTPKTTPETVARVQRNTGRRYPGLSMVFVPTAKDSPAFVRAGPWEHLSPPTEIPDWLKLRSDGFDGTIALQPGNGRDEVELVVRAVVPTISEARRLGYVFVDVPVDPQMRDALYEATGIRAGAVTVGDKESLGTVQSFSPTNTETGRPSLFGRGVTILDAREWENGGDLRASVAYTYRIGELYNRIAKAQQIQFRSMTVAEAILFMLAVVAILFFIIQVAALVMGLALARSITSSIHELFMGTERVRHGDFGHRINISTKDQLGELADSFNQMTGSIENLLQTAAEKKRLEEELRIARQIQMSLLPRGQLDVPGLSVTALCVPAREVGGDYYDFFPMSQDRLGLLIADVSGKGTSAALYMAELKGLVLSLSQIYESPRQLLVEVNRIISENLDSRSFITMTYAVLDVGRGTMTYARAGHTPMIYLPGPGSSQPGAQVLTPNGMVLGLRIEGANEKFAELLEEKRIDLSPGDVIVLYTDGITEAMNAHSDLFGESRLSRIVEEHGHLDSGELRERILREIEAFVGGADQHDDMTMILLKIEAVMAGKVAV